MSWTPGGCQTCCVAKGHLELLICLSLPPECWDYRYKLQRLVYSLFVCLVWFGFFFVFCFALIETGSHLAQAGLKIGFVAKDDPEFLILLLPTPEC